MAYEEKLSIFFTDEEKTNERVSEEEVDGDVDEQDFKDEFDEE